MAVRQVESPLTTTSWHPYQPPTPARAQPKDRRLLPARPHSEPSQHPQARPAHPAPVYPEDSPYQKSTATTDYRHQDRTDHRH